MADVLNPKDHWQLIYNKEEDLYCLVGTVMPNGLFPAVAFHGAKTNKEMVRALGDVLYQLGKLDDSAV
jgi:hypothetical protein